MMKKSLLFLLVLVFLFSVPLNVSAKDEPTTMWKDYAATSFDGGNGTKDDPYQIRTAEQLAFFLKQTLIENLGGSSANYENTFFKLTANIDLGAHRWWPVQGFRGYFDGDNHTISNVNIRTAGGRPAGGAGFFGVLGGGSSSSSPSENIAVVENLHIKNALIEPLSTYKAAPLGNPAGILAGVVFDARIINCSVEGTIKKNDEGAIGYGYKCTGGLIGDVCSVGGIDKLVIERCSADVDISDSQWSGGLIGKISGAAYPAQVYLSDCWANGTVTLYDKSVNTFAGGLIGYISGASMGIHINRAYDVSINRCYSYSDIGGAGDNIGGLIGLVNISESIDQPITGMIEISNSAALSPALASSREDAAAERLIGNGAEVAEAGKCSIENVYALDTMSVLGSYLNDDNFLNGTNVSKETLLNKAYWSNTLSFDFDEKPVWIFDEEGGYPRLNQALDTDNLFFFIEKQPADATAYRGTPALFAVTAGGGAMGYTYQWETKENNDAAWNSIDGATADTFRADNTYANGSLFHCVVTDQIGQTVTTEAAKLTVTSAKYTPEDAKNELVAYYRDKGSITKAKEIFGLAAVEDDFSKYTAGDHFWSMYTDRKEYNSSSLKGNFPYALMDGYILGMDPHNYLLTGYEDPRYFDLLDRILSNQNSETGAIYYDYYLFPMTEYDLPALILSLEMYFDGGAWGNEEEGTMLGRDGAIKYFFSSLKKHSSGGLIFADLYCDTPNAANFDAKYHIRDQRSLAEAAILAARLTDDPEWGDQAEEALSGLMKTLEYLYDTRNEEGNKSYFNYTESLARYVSALIAAGNATDNWFKRNAYFSLAEDIVSNNDEDSLLKSKAMDGTYDLTAGESSQQGNAEATAAVMMALSDYANQKSILMDYVFEVPDKDAAALDLNKIELPNPVTGDLELPKTGLNGSEITWETSDKSAITTAGKVTRGDEDATVVLTATATKGEAVATRSFELVVKAKVSNADEDALDAVLNALYVPMETTHDITLGTSQDDSVTLVWESSNAEVLSAEGKVNRPADGNDAEVTLKATVSKGESLSKSKEFVVKVYAQTDDTLKKAYYLTRDKYLNNRTLNSYWEVWAAYAALGDYIADPDNGYSVTMSNPSSDWYGTQYGASVNAIVAMGENPYNYKGKNWVKMLQDNYGGPFSGPVFSELGMEAAGAGLDYGFSPKADAGISSTSPESMTMGIDIAGWAAVILGAHHGEEGVAAAETAFIEKMKSMGFHESGKLGTSGNVNFISNGCAIMGLAALYSVGYTDADVTTWTNEKGLTPVDAVYQEGLIDEIIPGYNTQIEIALCDLYKAKYLDGTSTWVTCRVSGEKLAAQEAAANEILADKDAYEAESIKAIEAALAVTAQISEERRSAKFADYGEEYYALYDAVRYAEKVGQAEKDAEAAAAVTKQLNALDAATDITLSDKDAVEAARAAYDGLTDKQKSLVDKDALDKLTAAEKALAELESGAADQDAAAQVKKAINALPDVKELLASDADAVKAARAAYDGLNDAQKALVPEKSVAKLEALEARLAELEGKDVADISAMTDVKAEDWFYDDVAYVLGNGLFKGMTETTFGPQEWMTRAQFVTVLGRYAGVEDSSAAYPNQTIFGDVPANAYYASHVKWATDHGVTVGTSATTFSPNANISRQDMSVMMLRFAKAMGISLPEADDAHFADDADIAEYAKEAVYRMKAAGILNGKGDDMFMPKEQSKRCEVAAVLHRFFTQEEDVPSVVLSMEKFTLGQGYVIEPMVIELEEGDTVASVFLRAAEENDIEVNYDESGTFYLRSVKDNDTREAVIPSYILNSVTDAGGEISGRGTENWLGEFDYYTMAGWMFCLNNEKPKNDQMELGAGQAVVKDGDVIRWQFTISGLGADIGLGYKTDNLITAANKDALTAAVAKANSKTKNTDAYKAAVQVLMNLEASQDEVDAALKALK